LSISKRIKQIINQEDIRIEKSTEVLVAPKEATNGNINKVHLHVYKWLENPKLANM
jgi:hypothetical protein